MSRNFHPNVNHFNTLGFNMILAMLIHVMYRLYTVKNYLQSLTLQERAQEKI